ncbi:MAG: hypothetical protein CVU44_16760 [Chloroflexi bacterium HGW-Chloroflexi-6]|nr:MAG: hypothetical protein CVU44_16760 [Chloroflexi bacterium HGW-Chloroflexi-6]
MDNAHKLFKKTRWEETSVSIFSKKYSYQQRYEMLILVKLGLATTIYGASCRRFAVPPGNQKPRLFIKTTGVRLVKKRTI